MNSALEKTLYHSFLKVAAGVVACVLVFDSGLLFSGTAEMSTLTQQYMMANVIGITVATPANDIGYITELEAEEPSVVTGVEQHEVVGGIDTSTFVLSILLFVLLVLIVLNYLLDFLRAQRELSSKTATSQVN